LADIHRGVNDFPSLDMVVRRRRVEREREQQGKNDAFHDPNCGFNLPLAEVETSLAGIELYWRG
jgi:hypothetical protein